jgi:hypothetical protein
MSSVFDKADNFHHAMAFWADQGIDAVFLRKIRPAPAQPLVDGLR